jgi:hypothetical protein
VAVVVDADDSMVEHCKQFISECIDIQTEDQKAYQVNMKDMFSHFEIWPNKQKIDVRKNDEKTSDRPAYQGRS